MPWIESQNEYWLETEATLRKIFDVNSGTKIDDMAPMKYKSKMKDVYKSCNIPVARYILISTYENAINFTREVGYPVVVKPDNGVHINLKMTMSYHISLLLKITTLHI